MTPPSGRPPAIDPTKPEQAPSASALPTIMAIALAATIGAAALVWAGKRRARPNDDLDYKRLLKASPEAALWIMPLAAPSYYASKWAVRRYAPSLEHRGRALFDSYFNEPDSRYDDFGADPYGSDPYGNESYYFE